MNDLDVEWVTDPETLEFPSTQDEAREWVPTYYRCALSRTVLVVAKTRIEGAWAAYCDSVPGKRHQDEFLPVTKTGAKLPEQWARPMFPFLEHVPYAR